MSGAKRGIQVGLGQLATQLSSFVRYAIVARLLTPAEFGIAALFVTALQLVDMVSNVAAETLLVQAPDGDDVDLQSNVQWLRAARGCLSGAIIALSAPIIAHLFGLPGTEWEIRLLGLFPAIRGFFHVDANRLQRHFRYLPWILSDTGSNVMATFVGIGVAWVLRDHRAIVAAMLTQALASVAISHAMAERPYRWKWEKLRIQRIMKFGWPLMLNGLLLFGIFQGDRLLIGMARTVFGNDLLGLRQLGLYAAVFSLAMAPALASANVASSLFLPLLSRVQDAPEEFAHRYSKCLRWMLWTGLALGGAFITSGQWLVEFVSGVQYRPDWWLVSWLGLLWSLRVVRVAPTVAALALGDTKNALYSNLVRTLSLVAIAVSVSLRAGVDWIAFCGFAGEVAALAASLFRLKVTHNLDLSEPVRLLGAYAAILSGLGVLTVTVPRIAPLSLLPLLLAGLWLPGVKERLPAIWNRRFRPVEGR